MDAGIRNGVKLAVYIEDRNSNALGYHRRTLTRVDIVGLRHFYGSWHGTDVATTARVNVPVGPQGDQYCIRVDTRG